MYLVSENCGDNLFVLISENRGDNQSGGYQQNWSKYKKISLYQSLWPLKIAIMTTGDALEC